MSLIETVRANRVEINRLAAEHVYHTPTTESILFQAITGSPTSQTVSTASYGANRLGLEVGRFVHIDLGGANEEYVQVMSVDPDNQTFDAIVTGDHVIGESIRPAMLADARHERRRRPCIRYPRGLVPRLGG